jgi:hypothetical protein
VTCSKGTRLGRGCGGAVHARIAAKLGSLTLGGQQSLPRPRNSGSAAWRAFSVTGRGAAGGRWGPVARSGPAIARSCHRALAGACEVGSTDRPMPELSRTALPAKSRWTSFVADTSEPKPRTLREEANPAHRLRVEHNRDTILVHLSDEDGRGWTVLAVDRPTRRWAVGASRRRLDAAREAFERLYSPDEQLVAGEATSSSSSSSRGSVCGPSG